MYLTQLCCIFTTTNTMKIIFKKYSFLLVFITLFTAGCSSLKEKGEEDIIKKETPNPNMRERILSRESVGIFDSARSRMVELAMNLHHQMFCGEPAYKA